MARHGLNLFFFGVPLESECLEEKEFYPEKKTVLILAISAQTALALPYKSQ